MRLRNFCQRHKKAVGFCVLFILFVLFYSKADRNFQDDSETLVTGVIRAERSGIEPGVYGMGRFVDIIGEYNSYEDRKPFSGLGVQDGYMLAACGIFVEQNAYSDMVYKQAAAIKFPKGQILKIKEKIKNGKYYVFYLEADGILDEEQAGKISGIRFIGVDGSMLPAGMLGPYGSQYGLPGKVFAAMCRIVPDPVFNFKTFKGMLNIFCAVIGVCVFIAIGYYVGIKYNNWLLAAAFWLTFMASTWVRDFAINLYWVEFTWFMPMLAGLYCSVRGGKWQIRWLCYALAFLSLMIKSLSGYEYLSTVMIAMVMFPLADAFKGWRHRDYALAKKAVGMVVGLGLAGLLGFFAAFSIHACERGNGDISAGVESIYHRDVLRRTWAGNAKGDFPEVYQASFNAGIFDMVKIYCLRWNRVILLGVSGKLFPVLFLLPPVAYLYFRRKKQGLPFGGEIMLLYALSFAAAFSWYALAKSHSYVHTGMNYVLWYFGFVQVCLYVAMACVKNYLHCHKDGVMRCFDKTAGLLRGQLDNVLR